MQATTPRGSFLTKLVPSPLNSEAALPSRLRLAPAKNLTLSAQYGTSESLDSFIGFPWFWVSILASPSAFDSINSAILRSTLDLSPGDILGQGPESNADLAASMALDTSSLPALGTVDSLVAVDGFRTS